MHRPNIVTAPHIRPLINVGACIDIPSGIFLTGLHGESILNGGVSIAVGITGKGNTFKSTFGDYLHLRACARMMSQYMGKYDTETNTQQESMKRLSIGIPEFKGRDIIDEGVWQITDETLYYGNQWYEEFKNWCKDRIKNKKSLLRATPFSNKERNGNFMMVEPVFNAVDSLTKFQTEDVVEMTDKNELGEKGANTIFMRQGLSKMRMLMEMPPLINGAGCYIYLTSHMGKGIPLDAHAPPDKKLQFLGTDDKMKGVTEQFTFLTTSLYHCVSAIPLLHRETKSALYPAEQGKVIEGDTDLMLLTIKDVRSKSGSSGRPLRIIVSQVEGVLSSMTEFYNIKEENDNFGISGNNTTYYLDLYPDVKLMRTTVRQKINSDTKLQRALNITSEMAQIFQYMRVEKKYICNPAELYQGIKDRGYDWDMILSNTRGWWTLEGQWTEIPFLSTMDLLKMRVGDYIPYWMSEEEKSKIKKD